MTLINVTNFEINDWFKSISKNIDVWITDPPYPFNSQNGTGRYSGMYKRLDWKSLNNIFSKMYSITNDGGRIYIFCNRDGISNTINGLNSAGFRFLNLLIWDKQHFGGGYHWRNQAEYIVYASKGKPQTYVRGIGNVFNYSRPKTGDIIPSINYDPTSGQSCKPYQIWEDIMINGCLQGDICADPFSGSNPMRAAILQNNILQSKISEVHTNVFNI